MKYAVILMTLLVSLGAQAEDNKNFAQIQYNFRDTIASNSDDTNRQGVNFAIGRTVLPGITLDLNQQFRTERLNSDKDASNSTRLEAGATLVHDITKTVALYGRGAIGQKFTSDEDHTYYSVEPGVRWKAFDNLTLSAGYRYRTAFNDSVFDKTNTVRVGAQFDLDKSQALTFGVDRSYGDSEFLGINAGYKVSF